MNTKEKIEGILNKIENKWVSFFGKEKELIRIKTPEIREELTALVEEEKEQVLREFVDLLKHNNNIQAVDDSDKAWAKVDNLWLDMAVDEYLSRNKETKDE